MTKRFKAKKNVTRALALLLVMATALFGLSGCLGATGSKIVTLEPKIEPPAIIKEGTLTVGVDSTRAPYAGISKGNLMGIDVDIAAALADMLGLKLELVDIAGQNADELLQTGVVDMIMDVEQSGVTITQGKIIGPYILSGPALFMKVRGTTVPEIDLKTLKGAKIYASKDSLSAWTVDDVIGAGTAFPVDDLSIALAAVNDDEATYAAADAIIGSFSMAKVGSDVCCVKLFPDSTVGVYIAVQKTNPQLAEAITESLRSIRENGTLAIILAKWLGSLSASVVANKGAIIAQDA